MMAPLEFRRQIGPPRARLWCARLLWRTAFVLLAIGGYLLKYRLIGPIGMRRIWHCAEFFENLAERLRYSTLWR